MTTPVEPTPPKRLLRPGDQRTILALLLGVATLMAAVWYRHGGHRGQMIEIDRAPPLTAQFQVDVNQAEWPELVQLPGVGKTLARRMVEERQRNGAFRDLDDLDRVSGIGPRTLQRIRPYLLPIPKDSNLVQH